MRNLFKTVIIILITLLLSASFIHGADQKQITMRFLWWGSETRHKATLETINLYQQKNPGVKIEAEYQGYDGYQSKLMIQLSSDAAPDIIQVDPNWLPDFAVMGTEVFVDLNKEKNVDLSQFSKGVLDKYCSINGKLIGLPMGMNGYGMMINKIFFKKFDIPLDTEWTWDKIMEIGKKVQNKDKNSFLFCLDSRGTILYFINEYLRSKTGKIWISDDFTLRCTKEELIEAFKVLKNLYASGAMAPFGDAVMFEAKLEQYPKWINGQLGMIPDWSGTLPKYKAVIKPENFAVAKNILVKGGKDSTSPTKPSMLISVSKKSQNVSEAVKFANWLLNDKEAIMILKDVRSTPGSAFAKKTLIENNLVDKDIAQLVEWSGKNPSPFTFLINNIAIQDITRQVCEKIIFNQITPNKAADELIKKIQAKLDELKAAKK